MSFSADTGACAALGARRVRRRGLGARLRALRAEVAALVEAELRDPA